MTTLNDVYFWGVPVIYFKNARNIFNALLKVNKVRSSGYGFYTMLCFRLINRFGIIKAWSSEDETVLRIELDGKLLA